MTTSEWASWVQAVGSIFAIFGATAIAVWQSKQQHRISLEAVRTEHSLARLETAKALLSLSKASLKLLEHTATQFPDREAVYSVAEGRTHFDFNELQVVEGAVRAIPLYTLPHNLVHLTMIVSSTVRQFRENVESALQKSRALDADAFNRFFEVLKSSESSLACTCADIEREVNHTESEA